MFFLLCCNYIYYIIFILIVMSIMTSWPQKKETEKLSISWSLMPKNQAPASFQLALASFKIPAKVFFSSSFSIAI